MVTHWLLGHRPGAPFQLPLTQVTALLQKLGLSGRDAVAEDLLQVVGEHVPLAQCTIFAYEGRARPRMVAIGDRSRTEALPHITQGYLSRYHRLDSILAVMEAELPAARRAPAEWPHIVLHRQSVADINHPGYRDLCYEQPQISERLSVLALYDGWRWLSVNFYRGLEHGPFDSAALAVVEAFAPLVVHAVRLHHAGQAIDRELPHVLLGRLQQRHTVLTKRDLDLVRGLVAGQSTVAIAAQMGITRSSAETYRKRLYRKLGISGQRELLALLMATGEWGG